MRKWDRCDRRGRTRRPATPPVATPQGLACLTMTQAGSLNTRTHSTAVSVSAILLNDSSLPWSMVALATHEPGDARARDRTPPSDAGSRHNAGPGFFRTPAAASPETTRRRRSRAAADNSDTMVSYFAVWANALAARLDRVSMLVAPSLASSSPSTWRVVGRIDDRPSPIHDFWKRRAPWPVRRCRCFRWRPRKCSPVSPPSAQTGRDSPPAGRWAGCRALP